MKRYLTAFAFLVAAVASLASPHRAQANAKPDCGGYDWENWDYEGPNPPIVFTGNHIPGETYYFDGYAPTSPANVFAHTFDVDPDSEPGIWQLKYCMHITDSRGRESIYGNVKYFEVDDSGVFSDDNGDEAWLAMTLDEEGNPLPPNQSDVNLYTYNDVGGTDDYMRFVITGNGGYAMHVTISAKWTARLVCE